MEPEQHAREQPEVVLHEVLTLISVVSSYTQLLRWRHERSITTNPATMLQMLANMEQAVADMTVRIRLVEDCLRSPPDQ
jgi:hypothetical protein